MKTTYKIKALSNGVECDLTHLDDNAQLTGEDLKRILSNQIPITEIISFTTSQAGNATR
jgi:hypothetical protein